MQTFYPSIKPYAEHRLKVDEPHEIYVEECGNPSGIPVLVVHSGPGAGCEAFHRRFFDPELYRIVLFDQRGAGRSTPHAELRNNTTQDLISDMETIRQSLEIDKWALFGGAWGSTLALLYAEEYPHCVSGLLLHSVFLGRDQDINWFYKQGASKLFPDYWEDFCSVLNEKEKENPLAAYYTRLNDSNEFARMASAKSWSLWQARCAALQPHHNIIDHFSDPRFAIGLACIEALYFTNKCFIEENQILSNTDKIRHVPTAIVHGRYNIVSPLENAWLLQQEIPSSDFYIIRDAGHASKEPGIIDALVLATKKFAKLQRELA